MPEGSWDNIVVKTLQRNKGEAWQGAWQEIEGIT